VRLLTLHKYVDLTGKVFGERVVLGLSHQTAVSGNYYWFARCSCGREDVVSGTRLRKGSRCIECSGRENGKKGLYTQSKNQPVYFIKCNDYVKVGSSFEPKKRLKALESANPYPLELLRVDKENNEEYWHKKLSSAHHKGEWYLYKDVCEIVDVGG
jgi:hypothetical protein